ncbi:MAG: DoxX family protein [Candidatus Acidiferrum sp.]
MERNGYGLKGTTAYLTSTGLPIFIAYAFFEFLGGVGVLRGLRLAALAIIIVMLGAIAKVHRKNAFFINWELAAGKGHGFEANFAFIAMALACVIAGGGALSLDALLKH